MSGASGKGRRLTAKQRRFVAAFARLGDAAAAALEAGYAPRTAAARGRELLRRDHVQRALERSLGCAPGVADPSGIDGAPKVALPAVVDLESANDLTAEVVCLGLYREATFLGKGASHTARVRAWECLARVRAGMDRAAQEAAGGGGEAQPVVFDIRLGDAD